MKWMPIETAPKDGTPVLIFDNPIVVAAYFDTAPKDSGGQTWRMQGMCEWFDPSHWMPLPPPPTDEQEWD